MAWGLEANGFKGEGVVGADRAIFFDKEQFVVGLVGWQVTNTAAIEGEAIQRRHFQDGMFLCVVMFLDPVDELTVEHVERAEVEGAG